MNSFVEKVKNALCENDMVVPGDRILVAVSGGPDSVALLHALFELRSESDIDLAVCH
ncbi:MAG: tRNA(Ile)-lysidine synthetase, partial [Nitrospinaceae bacterium]|nr:tRNA(Ile)-lysidine synthetase [Nitrospinaceae bacterium]